MTKPASAPDIIRPRKPEPSPAGDGEGTNATRHEPDPQARPLPDGQHKHIPSSPYTPRQ